MRKGENIFKRKDGRWEARYIKGHELSGKAKYGFCYGKTYKEAKEKVSKHKAAIAEGRPDPPTKLQRRFAFYCDEWLELRKSNIRESSFVKYKAIVNKHIKPALGDCLPQNIDSGLIHEFTSDLLLEQRLAPKTVHDILALLHSILKYTAEQFPGTFPAVDIRFPKKNRKEMRVLSREEQRRLVAYLSDQTDLCKFGVLLMLLSGIRIGELCALKWENIDLKAKTIRISATLQRLHDDEAQEPRRTHIVISQPKSDTSVRTIPMTDHAVKLCKRFQQKNSAAYILTGTEQYMEPRALQYRIKKYTRDCNLNDVHAHTLRHTFATRAVEVGFEIKSLSEILGHANTTITMDCYVHSSMDLKRANMEKLTAVGL